MNKFTRRAGTLLLATSAIALTAAPASAAECLLDTNDDGTASAADTDGGAVSSGNNTLACGVNARATGLLSVAIGFDAEASRFGAVAIGAESRADGGVAIG